MENLPDHEYQRIHLLRAIRHAQIEGSELWLHYFGLGGDAGEYEVEAYLHGSFTLPPLQRDLLAHAANELIDRLPPPPRAPYSTDPAGTADPAELTDPVESTDPARSGEHAAEVPPRTDGTALDWLFDHRSDSVPGGESGTKPGRKPGEEFRGEPVGEPGGQPGPPPGVDTEGSGPSHPHEP